MENKVILKVDENNFVLYKKTKWISFKTLLYRFCKRGNLDLVNELIKKDQEKSNNDYSYAFVGACSKGNLKIAKRLLEIKPDINVKINNYDGFKLAIKNNHMKIIELFLEMKGFDIMDYSTVAMNTVIKYNRLKIYDRLTKINNFYDIFNTYYDRNKSPIEMAITYSNEYILADLLYNYGTAFLYNKAFLYAIRINNIHIFNMLLKFEEIDVTYNNNQPFIHACEYGYLEMVKTFLKMDKIDASFDNNKALYTTAKYQHQFVNKCEKNFIYISKNTVEIVKLLLKKKNVRNKLDMNLIRNLNKNYSKYRYNRSFSLTENYYYEDCLKLIKKEYFDSRKKFKSIKPARIIKN